MMIELQQAAERLLCQEDILILSHQAPDGDTIGSAIGLWHILTQLGKRAKIECADEFPGRYDYILQTLYTSDFEPKFVVAVDVADPKLLGNLNDIWGEQVDLCIDHHGTNVQYAKETYVDASAAATTEILVQLAKLLPVEMTKPLVNALFTGLSTDTGCFRYSNVTVRTMMTAAELMEYGADSAEINRILFDTITRARLRLEQKALESLEYYFEDQCALMYITQEMMKESGALENDADGLAALPRKIEGVKVGVTLREKPDGCFKGSLRTCETVNAAEICALLGGGGHPRAAGCTLCPGAKQAKEMILPVVKEILDKSAQ